MQVILVSITIFGAVAYLGWQLYKQLFKKDSGCGGCPMNKVDL